MPDNRITIHADMDYFFAQCEEREHPELKGKPVVICVYSGRGGDSSAKKLNPDAVFLPVNMELYRSVSDEVMEIFRGFSNIVEQE